ncbi:MAG: cupin domain-containing protein [Porticoccaceae bacterium]
MQPSFRLATLPLLVALAAPLALADEGYRPEIASTLLHRATTTADGAPIRYPASDHPEVSTLEIVIPPGAETGWHKHPAPLYTYVMAGEVEVELEGGKLARYGAGDVVYEVVDSWHNGVNRGSEDVRLIVFALGSEGAPLVIPRE